MGSPTPSRIGLIAGAGRFPFYVAQEATRQGVSVVAVGLQGWADPSLASAVERYDTLPLGQLGRLMHHLKSHSIQRVIMAGKVTKEILLDQHTAFDAEALQLLSRVKGLSVPEVLGAIAKRFSEEGITLLDSSTYLADQLCPAGVLTARGPTAVEQEDIRVGVDAARQLAALDIGQTVIVKGRIIVAIEALEGTDAAIRRAHVLAGTGLVLIKVGSPQQDRRFDLPVIGRQTMDVACEAGVSCLAVEAGTTLLLERDALVTLANSTGLCLVGITPPRSS